MLRWKYFCRNWRVKLSALATKFVDFFESEVPVHAVDVVYVALHVRKKSHTKKNRNGYFLVRSSVC